MEDGWNNNDIEAVMDCYAKTFTFIGPNFNLIERTGKEKKQNSIK